MSTEFVCFLVENQPIYIELQRCLRIKIPMEKRGLLYTVTMPKWVTIEAFSFLQQYLNNQFDPNKQITDQTLQRLLWLGDHLQLDEFQELVIKNMIIERISFFNCVLFLNEAFKKLKACEESSEVWYQMLNLCMNFTAKNLIIIWSNNPQDISKINAKVIEEILERALKINRKTNQQEMLQIVFEIRGSNNIIDVINQQKELLKQKKLNYTNHPSINWKLSNLSSIVNKETQQFKFSDFTWKLVAKQEENRLKIYLKLEEIQGDLDIQILCLYFQLCINGCKMEELKTVSIVCQKGVKVELCEFKGIELMQYDSQKLEFTVYLNTDQVLILCFNHLLKNLNPSINLTSLSSEDQMVLFQATADSPQPNKSQIQQEQDRVNNQSRSYSQNNSSRFRVNRTEKSVEISNSQTRSQSNEKNINTAMPINKLQQLKKTPSLSKFEEPRTQSYRKTILDEINIVNFIKIKDLVLITQLNDILKQYI